MSRENLHGYGLLLSLTLAACEPSGAASSATRASAAPSASQAPASASVSSSPAPAFEEVPTWPALPLPAESPRPPAVTSYVSQQKPTLVVFFGTWCGGCVASVLSDAELTKRFSPRVRVGLALMADTDEAFTTFARGVRAPLAIEVWRDDPKTRALKERCDIHGLPMSCLLDESGAMLWRGEPGSAARMLHAFEEGRLPEAVASAARAAELVDAARAASSDAALRARALEAASGLAGLENAVAWPLAEKGEALELAASLARDATSATSGLDFAILDTYALALWKLGRPEPALAAATRAMAVCDALGGHCPDERARYEEIRAGAKPK